MCSLSDVEISDSLIRLNYSPFIPIKYNYNNHNYNEIDYYNDCKFKGRKVKVEKTHIYKNYSILNSKNKMRRAIVKTEHSFIELDTLISDISKGHRHFIYKELVFPFKLDIYEQYKKIISSPIGNADGIPKLMLISPCAFLKIFCKKNNFNYISELDLLFSSDFKYFCLELKKVDGMRTEKLSDVKDLPILYDIYDIIPNNDRLISFYNIIYYREKVVFNKKINLSFSNERIAMTNTYEFVEWDGLIYKIPWVLYNCKNE